MAGDTLARGGRSAIFGPNTNVSAAKWDSIWADPKQIKTKPVKVPKEKLSGK